MRLLWTLLAIVIAVPAAVLLAFWAGQRSLMYVPSGDVGTPDDAGLGTAESVRLRTDDGLELGAWFAPAASTPARGGAGPPRG